MSTVEVGVRLAFDPAGPVEPEPSGRTMAFGHPGHHRRDEQRGQDEGARKVWAATPRGPI